MRRRFLWYRSVFRFMMFVLLFFSLFGCSSTSSLKEDITLRLLGIQELNVSSTAGFNHKNITKLAIVVSTNREYNSLPYRLIEDQFMLALLEKGYQIASRSDIEQIMEELDFQYSSLSEENVAEIGKMLNVSEIFIVSVPDLGEKRKENGNSYISASLSARLLGVKKGEVLWIATCIGTGDDAGTAFRKIAEKTIERFPTKQAD